MTLLDLSGSGTRRLLDDASGTIDYTPDFLPPDTARQWFEVLATTIPWRGGTRVMYEREVDVPRLRAHYRADDPDLPAPLGEALARVGEATGAAYDSLGLNLYRDHRDSVAPHNDKLADLVEGEPIALLSLGDTRRLVIRAKAPPRRVLQVDMEGGSLLVMSWATQLHYDHGIPKERHPAGPRISIALRVRGRAWD
jgi:alkylated DNA repair dioxygenase AlkB